MLWGKLDQANNAPKHKNVVAGANTQVRGNTAFNNTTVGVFGQNQAIAMVGANANEVITTRRNLHPGWNLVRWGTGPVTAVTVTGGSGFVNGDTITTSNGIVNGTISITTNATGNAVSGTIVVGGTGFKVNTEVVAGFNRERHLSTVTVAGTPTGYSNTDTIHVGNGSINGTATFTTNATGGFSTATVTLPGTFANTLANNQVSIRVVANTGANSAGSGATLTANLVTSTGGSVTINTLGGRAGRRHFETMVFARLTSESENTILPG